MSKKTEKTYSSYSRTDFIERITALEEECEKYKNRLKGIRYYELLAF